MKSIQRIALTLGFSAGLLIPSASRAEGIDPARLQTLMDFAAEGLDVSSYEIPPPRIVYKTFEYLQVSQYGLERASGASGKVEYFYAALAVYNFDTSEMWLIEDIDYSRPEHEWVLVHELAHYFQEVYPELYLDKVRCIIELERSAYRVSNMWTIATGHGRVVDFIPICGDD